ncbi:MAG: T9SS type A sorting domain-containing protein [Flavobacterium sp.]|nr:MAG: T9SS type A sorting domain-containing protein [Flavobacterium sp.]
MKKIYTLLFLAVAAFTVNAQTTIVQWNFNGDNTTPSTGLGTLNLIGGTTEGYALGNNTAEDPNRALNITQFAAPSTGSGTGGIRINTSTVGFQNIVVKYDRKGSNTASRWEQFEYTVDGINWIVLGNNGGTTTNVGADMVWPTTTYTIPATANNNLLFSCRMTSIFAPSTTNYVAIGDASNYAGSGTWRFDNITVTGTPLVAGVKDNSIAGLSMFPNPLTGNVLNITSTANSTKAVAIFDVLGKQVMNTKVNNGTVNVSGLNSGVYIVKITEEGKTATRKLVIK